MFSPRCHLLLHHDIFDFIESPSFVALRYFVICKNFFRLHEGNTAAQPRAEILREASTQLFASAAARR
jgi:hypothetical protein